ncbi:type I polyketide synthase [Nocardia bhagyanarayanae]|uniref:Phthiocerol/phenolphthiocerol synthesis type-I polyketide synthase D n=1 Tax=Nocardia bhagyanarayanae TaxID=1215925 RepID=A0A543F776_9NOCA|nr:type I polyketide synthase [Nocardia bhagyanarayanae]TQM29676.1 phthiocerol/phenolphthiocerol synthesis type-I polyketide synthase D [Nocardia bhagyanarayanae]
MTARTPSTQPSVAIVGMACRVPGAAGLDEFWRLLMAGRDATGDPPPGRSVTRRAGYLDDIEWFDNDWFAISAREAALMDPQQRVALEVSVEALDDAGIGYRTRGSDAAVVFGACGYDHGVTVLGGGEQDAPYAVTGSALSIIANRLSYALDLHGPSLVVDSACSSSLAAVDIALRLLADETVPFAIVGGVNLTLLPHTSDYLAESGFLAEDGRCKPFSAAADGYTRSDGCGVLVLQRTADARREGNRVYAEILGAAVGSDGRSNGLYAPNGRAQRETLRAAWSRAGLDPRGAGYIECHGTGTALGDAVEVGALASVLGEGGETWIGSVKSNLGHLEAAAGVTGLIKTALSIHRGVIAPTIHFDAPNPLLKLTERGLRVPTEPVDWTAAPEERLAGVSSFGFGGTNAHVVLRGYPESAASRGEEPPVLIPVTGRDVADLQIQALALAQRLDSEGELPVFDGEPLTATRPVLDSGSPTATRPALDGEPLTPTRPVLDRKPSTTAPPTLDEVAATADATERTARASSSGWCRSSATAIAETTTSERIPGLDPTARTTGEYETATTTGHSTATAALRPLAAAAARLLPENARASVIAHDRATAVAGLRALARGESGPAITGPGTVRRRGGVLFLFSGQGGQHARMGRALAARYPVFARALAEATEAIVAHGGPKVWTPRYGFGLGEDGRAATDLVQPAIFAYQVAAAKLLESWGIRPDAVAGHSLGEIAAAAVSGALTLPDAALVAVRRSRALATLDGQGAMALLEATPDETARLVAPVRTEVGIAAVNGPRSVVVSGTPRYIDTVVRRAKRRGMFAQRIAVDFAAHSPQVSPVLPEFVGGLGDLAPRTPHTPVYSTTRRGAVLTTAALDRAYWAENASGTVELAAALERAAADGLATVLELAPHPVLAPAAREYPEFRDATYPIADRDDEAGAFLRCLAGLYDEGRALDWSASGPFVVPPPRRRWRRGQFELITRLRNGSTAIPFRTGPLEDHVVRGVPTVPAVHWVRRLLHQAHSAAAGMIADFVVHERADLSVLPDADYRTDDAGVRAQAGAMVLASARPAPGPTPADIVAWMRAVDANRAAQHRMRPLAAASFYDMLRRRGLEYGPRFRPLRAIAAAPGCAIGHFDAAELHSAATLDGCLHLLAAAADALPDGLVPLPIAMDTAWVSTEPGRVVAEAHAVTRARTARGLIGDIVGTDQHGVPVLAFSGVRVRFADAGSMDHGRLDEDFGEEERPVFRVETWQPILETGSASESLGTSPTDAATIYPPTARRTSPSRAPDPRRALVVGESDLAVRLSRALERTLPTERIAREPDAASAVLASVLLARDAAERIALVLVWPEGGEVAAGTTAAGRVLDLLQRAQSDPAIGSLTVLLPRRARHDFTANALAGLTRTLQLESGRPVRLLWSDTDARTLPRLVELITEDTHPAELAVAEGELAMRRFVPAAPDVPPIVIDPDGTYVVTGGLGALGAVAVRWLLDAGARDVVVLTRSPRPVPAVLDGSEDHVVVVGCDVADRSDLANALNDIRECGSTIRGVVHAAGALEDAAFEAVDADQLARMFAPKAGAAADLVALTAADPTDFVLLFSSATGAFGAPGQAAYAAANAAMDAVAAAAGDRRVLSIGWGVWATGLAATAGGAEHLRRAGINALDAERGAAMLAKALRYRGPYLLALDYTPTDDRSPVASRLRELLGEPSAFERSPNSDGVSAATVGGLGYPIRRSDGVAPAEPEPIAAAIRRVLAATLDLPAETIGPTDDFNDLGLSSLLAIEVRRTLEARLRIAISTAELFQHPTIAALGAALADRVAANDSEAS